jgi:hypothetical protein
MKIRPKKEYSKTGNHQQEDLAKFGYKPDSERGKI